MPHNDTDATEPLSSVQLKVLESLVAGESITKAAKTNGVSRETVHRWHRNNFAFRATLNRMKHELQESVDARLLATTSRAAENVAKAVADGDVKVSLHVLRGSGLLSGDRPAVGSDNPRHLKDDAEVATEEDRIYRIKRRHRPIL